MRSASNACASSPDVPALLRFQEAAPAFAPAFDTTRLVPERAAMLRGAASRASKRRYLKSVPKKSPTL